MKRLKGIRVHSGPRHWRGHDLVVEPEISMLDLQASIAGGEPEPGILVSLASCLSMLDHGEL